MPRLHTRSQSRNPFGLFAHSFKH
uniref:Uncharacterized protein n=1 Tax=Anguilla anguilla TaxID=7936 RepID=A0A0E9T8V7_ANGAN